MRNKAIRAVALVALLGFAVAMLAQRVRSFGVASDPPGATTTVVFDPDTNQLYAWNGESWAPLWDARLIVDPAHGGTGVNASMSVGFAYATPAWSFQSEEDVLNLLLPSQEGQSGKFLSTDGESLLWGSGSAGVTGSGTTNYLPKWASSSSLGNSAIIDSGGSIGIGGTPSYKFDVQGVACLRGSSSTQGIYVSSDGRVHIGGTNPTQAKLQMANGDATRHMFWFEDGGYTYSVVGRMKTTSDSSNTIIEMQDSSSGQSRSGGFNFLDNNATLLGQFAFNNHSEATGRTIKMSAGSTYVQASGNGAITLNGSTTATDYRVAALQTAPASATATGATGEIRYTSDYIYICVATNTWKRSPLSTW